MKIIAAVSEEWVGDKDLAYRATSKCGTEKDAGFVPRIHDSECFSKARE